MPIEARTAPCRCSGLVENKLNVSAFITYTDSETWAGNIHPAQALRQYRSEFVGDAKAVVVGMTSNGFTLADPNDRGMLDVVGFDTTAPAVIADFVRNELKQSRAEAKASVRAFNFDPVGRAARQRSAKPRRRVRLPHGIPFLPGIGVERHTPVFQTGVEGALPSCPSISQVNSVCRQRPRTVEVMAGLRIQCAWDSILRDAKTGAGHDGLTAAVQLRLRVASGLQTLTVKSRLLTGENSVRIRGNPPFPHPW